MKERPIIFSGPMVRAILEGRKTVTRRAVKPQPEFDGPERLRSAEIDLWSQAVLLRCPYGQPGNRLWVRETWQGPLVSSEEMEADPSWYKDLKRYRDAAHCAYRASGDSCEYVDPDDNFHCRWRPSIHMPRWASRILLEVTAVRAERLHAVSEAQAMAEGITQFKPADKDGMRHFGLADGQGEGEPTATHAFKALWESINGIGSWAANPWVWCVEFQRVTP